MIARLRILVLFAAACLLPLSAYGQTMGGTDPMGGSLPGNLLGNINPYNELQKHWSVAGKVVTLHGDPVVGAKVGVTPTAAAGEFRTLETNFQGEFRTEYYLNAQYAKEFSIDLKVTKRGFLPAHALIDFGSSEKTLVNSCYAAGTRGRGLRPALAARSHVTAGAEAEQAQGL